MLSLRQLVETRFEKQGHMALAFVDLEKPLTLCREKWQWVLSTMLFDCNTHFYCKHKSQQSAIFDPEATDDR